MPILDIQKRARELGRIRIGQVVPTQSGKTRPEKLDRFRLTSHSRPLLEKVAELYGGEVREWTPQGGGAKAWEVITDSKRLPIMVPPQPVSQWYEFWTAGGCKHRCDGRTNVLTDELCDPEDYGHKEAIQRPTTRLNVVLRDVEGIGVWRLETHGFNAAVELPDAAEFLAQAGGYVNGWVSLEPRTSKAEVPDGQGGTKVQTRHFHVPIIEIDVTPAELMAGKGRVQAPSLEGPVATVAAIEAPRPDYLAVAQAAATLDEVRVIWKQAADAGHLDAELMEQLTIVGNSLANAAAAAAPPPQQVPDEDGAVDAEIVEEPVAVADADAVWAEVLKAGGLLGMGLTAVSEGYSEFSGGLIANDATAAELTQYLEHLRSQGQAVAS